MNMQFLQCRIREELNVQIRNKNDWEWSKFRNWGSESERTDARNCFFPIYVKDLQIIGYGSVCDDNFHPKSNVEIKNLSKCFDAFGNLKDVNTDVVAIYPIDVSKISKEVEVCFSDDA